MNNSTEPIGIKAPDARIPWGLSGILLLILLLAFIRHVVVTLPFPYPVEYGEGVVLNWLLRLREGLALYPPMAAEDMPWLHNPYGPLWFSLVAPFSGWGEGVFTAARTISLIGLVLSLAFIYRLCRRDLRPVGAACVGALFCASPLVWRYALMARVDMAAIAASLAALVLMEKGRPDRVEDAGAGGYDASVAFAWHWFFAGLAASAAVLIKPIFVAAALTGLAAGRREWRSKGLAFGLGLLLPALAIGLWLWARGERAVIEHFGEMNRIGTSLRLMVSITLAGAGRHPFVLLALVLGLRSADRTSPRWWFALFMSVTLLLGGMKTGADSHYFLGPLTAGVLMTAPFSARIISEGRINILLWCLAAQFALYLPVAPQPVFTATYGQEVQAGHSALTPGGSDRRIGRLLVAEIRSTAGPVLADDPGYLLAAGRDILIQPFQYGRLIRAGRMGDAALQRRIEQGYFALIILRDKQPGGPEGSDFPPDVVAAVEENYQMHREVGPYLLYMAGDQAF